MSIENFKRGKPEGLVGRVAKGSWGGGQHRVQVSDAPYNGTSCSPGGWDGQGQSWMKCSLSGGAQVDIL